MALDLSDVQGLVFHAYRRHPHARYVLLRFADAATAAPRAWLYELVHANAIDSATPKDVGPPGRPGVRTNIAFTHSGLAALGLDADALATFPQAFVEGLGAPWRDDDTPDHRSRILGDTGDSAPARWEWGYQDDERRVDAMLLVFGTDAASADREVDHWLHRADGLGAARSVRVLHGQFPEDLSERVREPFGFVDGVSQPVLRGARGQLRLGERRSQPASQEIEDGEILLGHRDNARQFSWSPSVAAPVFVGGERPPAYALPREREPDIDDDGPPRRDFGRNGTYLVFRQMAQHVDAFHAACREAEKETGIDAERLKALIVGRWPNGSPLIKCPVGPDDDLSDAPAGNDFLYRDDPFGERCPIGAHVRRANPRDSLLDDHRESLRVSNRHRILRRGRPYADGGDAGLHFICLNADIVRQFEFIQQNWINDRTFGGLDSEVDPLIGPDGGRRLPSHITVPPPPEHPIAGRITGLARYVTVKGGGYFFLPGLTALRYLAGETERKPRAAAWEPAPLAPTTGDVVRFLSLTRFSLLLAAILALSPLSLLISNPAVISLVRPMFEMGSEVELAVVTMMASLAAAVALITSRLVQLYATTRFGVRTGWSPELSWGRVLRWQALSLPAVGAAVWLSDPATPYTLSYYVTRVLPRWTAAALAGYAAAFGLMYVAEAMRQYGIRAQNPEDAVILPLTRRLGRWRRTAGIVNLRLLKPIVDFIERRTALWPPEKGRGYIDHASGRILPGHLSALALMAVTLLVYVTGRLLFHPNYLPWRVQLPPAAYLLFLLFMGTWALTAAAFCLDRYRVPLLTLIAAGLSIATALMDVDHRFPVIDAGTRGTWRPGPDVSAVISHADEYVRRRRGAPASAPPIIVVAAGGGGAYQAAWTARVLTGLTDLWTSRFSGNLRLISAVSAGAVGSMHFLTQYEEGGPPVSDAPWVVDSAASAATGDVWWGFAYFDVLRMVLPLRIKHDRGWALEQAWHRAMRLTPNDRPPRMSEWQAGVSGGWRPAMAFNAMAVESGERVVLATYTLPPAAPAKSLGDITGNHDVAVVTAARLAASFPYVTPFARSDGDEASTLHIADGGYWDNHAVVTALEWLDEAGMALDRRDVILVRIAPPSGDLTGGADRSWVWQVPAPILALGTMRTNAQKARNDLDVQSFARRFAERQLANHPNDPKQFVSVEFASGGEESLSWHVSARERCRIQRRWEAYLTHPETRKELEKIAAVLGPPRGGLADVPAVCPP